MIAMGYVSFLIVLTGLFQKDHGVQINHTPSKCQDESIRSPALFPGSPVGGLTFGRGASKDERVLFSTEGVL
ncbi:hypothetical protein DAMNIGENAA_14930 [Desulforhabdus amnigena]|jgi:hypothetical protein|uniref:Uncharacterized protein n=1 Tax=Desulforhabdus amnigena TaxID=40218 RepID=A0A9W6D4N0_9BACT|nr:hypothetical protein DAMNIGENAA_14930 [Desulforhabdus amnigena]